MGKIKREKERSVDVVSRRTCSSGLLAITFLSVRFRARGERAYPPPERLFFLGVAPTLVFQRRKMDVGERGRFARERERKRESERTKIKRNEPLPPAARLHSGHSGP